MGGGFSWPVTVYYEVTDAAGIVYYANYLSFLERARAEWLAAPGFDRKKLLRHNTPFIVRSMTIDYLIPARLHDELHVTADVLKAGPLFPDFRATRHAGRRNARYGDGQSRLRRRRSFAAGRDAREHSR